MNNIVDFHTHILHGIDDGSKDIETSLKMLKEEFKQGVTRVVLTPHFYASRNSFSAFKAEREKKINELREFIKNESAIPKISLGAEVSYFSGISSCEKLKDLTIDNSNYLLLEMPFAKWDNDTIEDVLKIGENLELNVILAHFNRYFMYNNGKNIRLLAEHGVKLQLNSECLFDKKTKKESYKLLSEQYISFIGSDCHNLENRAPNLVQLKDALIQDFSQDVFNEINFSQQIIFED
jgi:protein-tyrosine phosphatase